jgi:GAF domain-containing protein
VRRRHTKSRKPANTRHRKTAEPNRSATSSAVRRASASATNLQEQFERQARELEEARQERAAIAEVLRVISASPGELEPVFQAMLENATRICGAKFGILFRYEGGLFHPAASHDVPPAYDDFLHRQGPFEPKSGQLMGRLCQSKSVIQIVDRATEPDPSPSVRYAGARSSIVVPLLKQNDLVGAFFIYRTEVRPFTDKQIALVQNFAAQAVIAIENTRLLNELRQRTTDLSESLEQQTATSEILSSMSGSMADTKPVFDAILHNLLRLFGTSYAVVHLLQDGMIHLAAFNGEPGFERLASHYPRPLDDSTVSGRAILSKRVLQFAPVIDNPAAPIASARHAREHAYNSMFSAPMIREDKVIGAIATARRDPIAFDDKQVALIKSFAAQAVIAIENARLLNELRESLQQQTATADVLKVISRAAFDLQTVLDTLVESATRVCNGDHAGLTMREGDVYRYVATYALANEFFTFLRNRTLAPGRDSIAGRTALEGKIVHVADLAADPEYRMPEAVTVGKIRTTLGVPLLRDGVVIGTFTVNRQRVEPFTERQIELVQTFADQAVIAIENARLLNELRESLEQQTATSDVLRVISSSTGDLQPVFDAMLTNATRLCDASYGMMWLRESDSQMRVAARHGNLPEAFLDQWPIGRVFRPSPSLPTARVFETRKPVQVVHLKEDRSYFDHDPLAMAGLEVAGIRTLISVPMLKEGEVVGTLNVYRREVRPFSEKQIELVKNFAAQAVIAIENARLLNELRQRTDDLTESLEQQTATSKVLDVISRSAFDLQAVFEAVAESSVRLCGADRAFIYRFDGELLRMAVAFNAPEALKDFLSQNPMRPGRYSGAARAALERRTTHIPDVLADPEYSYGSKDVEALRTVLSVPILKGNDLLGVVGIYTLEEVRPFTDKQIALVETFADQAAIAIDNVRLLDELRQSLQQQTATADVLKVISRSTFDLKTVLQTLVESVARLCEADMTAIRRPEGSAFLHVASHGSPTEYDEYMQSHPVESGRGTVAGRVLLEGKPVHIADVQADPEYTMIGASKRAGFHTTLGVPLLREGTPIGVIILARKKVQAFTDKQIDLATTFADQAVIAIENVRLFDEIQDKSRQLEEASQHKSQFLANMSHELRTPLNAILGYTELMADGAYGEPSEKMLGILKRLEANGKHLLGLINDVLDLSKIEAGQLVLELSDYCIQDIAQTVRSTLEPLASDKKLGFKLEVAPQLPSGHGDGRRLTQVLINLVGNAIKFTDAGEVAIKAEANNGAFYVSVRDTGPGISAADQAKLFQEFQQADNAITRKKGGTGLGLAISKRIIEMHGGRIWVESQPSQGSTFTFTLPVIVERQVESA